MLVQEETVRRALTSHRASRHFRNYWRNSPGQFSEFAELISKTWPGMAVEPPTLDYGLGGAYLRMFCLEERIPRELFWVGFGFQSWCQLLTHALRCRGDTLLVVDEPEIYLHPDVQRRLLNVLRELGPDILLATHSAEIISDADPSELLLVNKRYRSAKRLSDVAGVQGALDAIGSAQNVTLAQLARNRRVFFVEGNDFTVLRRFANKLRRHDVANGTDFTVVATGGFSNWERVRGMAWGLERTIGHQLLLAGAFDRDYRSQEEIAYVSGELAKHCAFVHIHERKEIENYLLDLPVLERATQRALRDRGRRRGADETMPAVDIAKLLTDITDSMHSDTLAQYIARRQEFRSRGREDKSAVVGATVSWFEAQWRTLDTRLQIVSGKAVLRALNGSLQSLAKVNLTVAMIVDEFHIEEIPADILTLLDLLDRYRRTTVIEETDEVEDE
ncbi:AAA family ATPase [Candidatus Uhrbacteria bacterium]|nr:AAA family ATPase [Candidatus Uhrbacteria bacterium]